MGLLNDLLSVFFPEICEVCGKSLVDGEKIICLECLAGMPRTDWHLLPEHPFVRRMAAAGIKNVASMFAYVRHDAYAGMIQKAKYNNRPDIIKHLSRLYAEELREERFWPNCKKVG